jgi:ADP-L-glycero-D-manno-heptose 6-epimerase
MALKILITGGGGFVGSNIAKELQVLYKDATITIFDKFNNGERRLNGNFKYFGDFNNLKNFKGKVITGDLSNSSDIRNVLVNDYDIIFHQGAISDTTVMDQEEVIRTNTNSLYPILEYCKSSNAKLIYASSAGTYGNSIAPNIPGKGEIPENVYGFSKLMMDEIVRNFMIDYPNIHVVGLRYFNVYGPGELYKRKTSSMILQLAKQAIDKKKVRVFKYGEQTRDFVYIKDVVQANILAIDGKSGIYNVGSGKSRSFNDIINILSLCMKIEIEIEYFDNPYKFYQNNTCADISASKNSFNYSPKFSLENGVKEYFEEIINYSSQQWGAFYE